MTLKPGLGSLKVIEDDTIRSGTHDLLVLLTFHNLVTIGLSRSVSQINSDIRRKSPIPPVYLTPLWRGFLWKCVSAQGSQETRMMGLSDGRKSFQMGLAILIQYRCVTDTQPASQPDTLP